ncbi:MAG: hypothetical protein IKZ44_03770 [Clostridia bacterium]|nr:hypothetical protein [Clostridia bacterium]
MGLGLLFPILLLAMGVYVLFGAIKGSGRLFSMENFKDDSKDKAKKYMRILYFALAAIMFLMAIVNGLQSALFSNKLTYYKITDAYKDTFPELIEDGTLTYTTVESASSGMSCMGVASSGQEVTYGPYSADNEKMELQEISAFINKAYSVYKDDQTKFPVSSSGMMSCTGGSVDYSKYYAQTDLLDDADNPVYPENDADRAKGHVVYVSTFGNVRSDANDGSFVSKLYGAVSMKLLSVLNYILLGLAVVGLIGLFLVTRKYTDKEKLQKAREQQVHGPSMPSSAFDFNDEKESDPVKK